MCCNNNNNGGVKKGGGGIRRIHDRGGSDVVLGLEIYSLCIFGGQEICHIFF